MMEAVAQLGQRVQRAGAVQLWWSLNSKVTYGHLGWYASVTLGWAQPCSQRPNPYYRAPHQLYSGAADPIKL